MYKFHYKKKAVFILNRTNVDDYLINPLICSYISHLLSDQVCFQNTDKPPFIFEALINDISRSS